MLRRTSRRTSRSLLVVIISSVTRIFHFSNLKMSFWIPAAHPLPLPRNFILEGSLGARQSSHVVTSFLLRCVSASLSFTFNTDAHFTVVHTSHLVDTVHSNLSKFRKHTPCNSASSSCSDSAVCHILRFQDKLSSKSDV